MSEDATVPPLDGSIIPNPKSLAGLLKHELTLTGRGADGYGSGGWREPVARWLRRVACLIEDGR